MRATTSKMRASSSLSSSSIVPLCFLALTLMPQLASAASVFNYFKRSSCNAGTSFVQDTDPTPLSQDTSCHEFWNETVAMYMVREDEGCGGKSNPAVSDLASRGYATPSSCMENAPWRIDSSKPLWDTWASRMATGLAGRLFIFPSTRPASSATADVPFPWHCTPLTRKSPISKSTHI